MNNELDKHKQANYFKTNFEQSNKLQAQVPQLLTPSTPLNQQANSNSNNSYINSTATPLAPLLFNNNNNNNFNIINNNNNQTFSLNDFNKFQHIAHHDQKQKILANNQLIYNQSVQPLQSQPQASIVNFPRNFNSFQRSNTIGSSLPHMPLSRSINNSQMPTAQPFLPLFSNYNLVPLLQHQHQHQQQQPQIQIPPGPNSISSNSSSSNSNTSQSSYLTEQEILDKSFLNIFNSSSSGSISPNRPSSPTISKNNEKKRNNSANIPVALNHQNKLVPTGQLNKPIPPPSKEKNLIDLEVSIDNQREMSALDLFDPLAQPKPIPIPKPESDQQETVAIENEPSAKKFQPPPLPTQLPVGDPLSSSQLNKETKRRNGVKETKQNDHSKKTTADQRIERFDIVELEKLNEFESFERSVNELTAQINAENEKSDNKKLSNLIVFSPTLDCSITNKKTIKMTVKYSHTTPNGIKYLQETLTPSLNATVETLVYHVLTLFDVTELNADKYLLKIHGSEEYLPIDATLSYLKYIHECLTENKEPTLVLTELKTVNTELSSHDNNDTKYFRFSFTKITESSKNQNQITKTKLETLLKSITQNRKLIEEEINSSSNYHYTNQVNTVLQWCINLREKLRYLIHLIYSVHFSQLDEVIGSLEFIEKILKSFDTNHAQKDKQPLMMALATDEGNSTGNTDTNLNSIYSDLVETSNKAIEACLAFVNCASDSFNLPFKLIPVYSIKQSSDEIDQEDEDESVESRLRALTIETADRKETIQSNEKLLMHFYGINRLGQILSDKSMSSNANFDLFLKFSICYGTRLYDSVMVRLDKYEKLQQKKQDYSPANQRIQFKNSDICRLQREAILLVQLCSSTTSTYNPIASNVHLNANASYTDDKLYKCHAWGSLSLFKDDLTLQTGTHLMCLFSGDTPQLCTSASNIYSNTCPVVQIAFNNEDYIYVYPNLGNECECILKDFQSLPIDVKENLLQICNKSVIADTLNDDEKDLIHEYYLYLNGIPNALNKVFLSFKSFDFSSLIHFYAYLKQCDPLILTESLELLLPNFPEAELRNHAVNSVRINSPETVALYLPQLLEALRYERVHNSELVLMLLSFASKNIRFAHKLYWQISEFNSRKEDFLHIRYELLYQALLHFFSLNMKNEIEQEKFLVRRIHEIGLDVKQTKDNDKLHTALENFGFEWSTKPLNSDGTCRLPYNVSYCTREIDIKSCSYISSFTMPLKLVFKNVDSSANSFYTIYKIGDDLRQDMFVLQLINVMNQLWLMEDHDLSVLTFTCLQTGDRCGFIEMVTNAETLKEIQKGKVMKAFEKNCINDWLKSHNPSPNNFRKAVINFTKSCAAYSVATYILGIGDRHNDNIMIKYTGHMFHIDFGKYLGDVQKWIGIKRDRTPILFTPDMFFVINQGKDVNSKFQDFIETCCKAFQILRKNYHHLLSLIELMSSSGIPGLDKNAIQYVYKNLMIDMNEDASSYAFKELIYNSLDKSRSGQFNFAIHTFAQPKTVNASNYFSFVTHTYNAETDGKIVQISLMEATNQGSVELFKCIVKREIEYDTNEIYRTFEEFCELYQLLLKTFPALKLQETPPLNKFKETKQTLKRRNVVESFLGEIQCLQSEISQSDIVYTFFHSILRDQKEDLCDIEMINIMNDETSNSEERKNLNEYEDMCFNDIKGQIKVKLKYKDNKFFVNCLQCRNLKPPNNQPVSTLKPYVKCYLRPDAKKATKKKVQALFNGANPIFTETMEYDISLIDFKKRTLEISVINKKINNKEKIGSVEIRLYDIEWSNNEYIKWYDLR